MLCGALANPLIEKPITRMASTTASNNLTITTNSYCATKQSDQSNAILMASGSVNFYSSQNSAAASFFMLNEGTIYSCYSYICGYLTGYFGNPTGMQGVSAQLQTAMITLTQAQQCLASINPTAAAAMTPKIQACATLQTQINTMMTSCATTLGTMYITCSDSLYTAICQFLYQSSTILCSCMQTWSADVINGVTTVSIYKEENSV